MSLAIAFLLLFVTKWAMTDTKNGYQPSEEKEMNYPKEIYLKYDPFSGSDRDADIRCHTFSIVKTKKSHQCMLANMIAKSHTIKKGQLARYDKAIVDGQWGGYYSCLDCMDIWLSEDWVIR